ncbi:MAG: ribose 5-phosphate isomerase B [Pseudomonadota bacterium]
MRRVAIGSDHAGFKIKQALVEHLRSEGIEAVDVGTHSTESVDFPDFGERVARMVSQGKIKEGILVCGTGIGMSIVANKFPGVRAAVVTDLFTAKSSRAHNDSNILCLGERTTDEATAKQLLDVWLNEPFEGGRHERRVNKIRELDKAIVPLPEKTEEPKP